jgi:hypothetical protein
MKAKGKLNFPIWTALIPMSSISAPTIFSDLFVGGFILTFHEFFEKKELVFLMFQSLALTTISKT